MPRKRYGSPEERALGRTRNSSAERERLVIAASAAESGLTAEKREPRDAMNKLRLGTGD